MTDKLKVVDFKPKIAPAVLPAEALKQKEVVDGIQSLLDQAKAGKITGFAAVGVDSSGSAYRWQAWPKHNTIEAFGAICSMKAFFEKESFKAK